LPRLLLDIDRAGTIEKLIRRLTCKRHVKAVLTLRV